MIIKNPWPGMLITLLGLMVDNRRLSIGQNMKIVPLKDIVDDAIKDLDFVEHVVILERTKNKILMTSKDKLWSNLMNDVFDSCPAEKLPSDHPLYILYTSGTTGKPKGVLHGTGGYLTHLHSTFKWAFDIKDSDIFFCTADIGWVTGHSYVVYAPFLHGATQVMYEGAPDFPDASRMWDILQKYKDTHHHLLEHNHQGSNNFHILTNRQSCILYHRPIMLKAFQAKDF